ncbi:hypothetical protein IH970_02315 [candidate division KSB1 bacterium]|nr:hypothetical protein [candidate division KSB1 bacterium]
MKFITVIAFLSFNLLLISPNYSAIQIDWEKIETPLFQVYYFKAEKHYAEELSTLLRSSYKELSRKLELPVASQVKVFLCPSDEIFGKLTGNYIPHWGAGVADPTQSVIVLKSPALTEDHDGFPKLVKHELVHIMIGQSVGPPGKLPRWFSEGIATLFSYDEHFASGKSISKALLSDSIIPLDEIDEVLKFHQVKATLAYEESYSFTLFLQEKFGLPMLVDLIHALNKDLTFEATFTQVFEADLFELELEWYEFLEKKYRWRFLLDFETFLWIFILFLFIFVFVAIRFKNRRIMNRWEEEEEVANSN